MQNKNGLKVCRIALQRKALLKVYKTPGPNPSGIKDLRQCLNFEGQQKVQKQLTEQHLVSSKPFHKRVTVQFSIIFYKRRIEIGFLTIETKIKFLEVTKHIFGHC